MAKSGVLPWSWTPNPTEVGTPMTSAPVRPAATEGEGPFHARHGDDHAGLLEERQRGGEPVETRHAGVRHDLDLGAEVAGRPAASSATGASLVPPDRTTTSPTPSPGGSPRYARRAAGGRRGL